MLVMMLVMVGVVFGVQYYRAKTTPPSASQAITQSAPQSATAPSQPTVAAAPSVAAPVASVPTVQAAAEATTVVENELYRIEFTNRGAQVHSWILKRFTDNEGKPLDLVHETAAAQFGYPLSLYTSDAPLNTKLQQALYVPSVKDTLTVPGSLTFTYSDGSLNVTKTFSFDETYVLHADVQVTQNGAPVHAALAWPSGFGDQENIAAYNGSQIDTLSDGKANHIAFKKVSGGATLSGPFDWGGVSDLYFTTIFLPDQPDAANLITLHNEIDLSKVHRKGGLGTAKSVKENTMVPLLGVALADTAGHTATRIFAGPKAIDVLRTIQSANGKNLEPLLNFGFFGFFGHYLFLALRFFHAHVTSSWGWSIILLTIVFNVLLLPLRIQSMKSALKMQRIQPQINAIKQKYKNPKMNDPKAAEMNAEIMKFQRDSGVNVLGGCIPSLLPMPLFIAFYTMLPNVVELRHASWFWLPDLSQPDPFYVLPILMIVSQFLVQFYTPSPGVDPAQQKMMAFMMPAFFGFIMLNYASGLALYWATGNLISITTQAVMNRSGIGREMRELAAKRARRKGNTIQGKR